MTLLDEYLEALNVFKERRDYMNGKQAIQENPTLRKINTLLGGKSQIVDLNFSVDESIQTYVDYIREQNIRTLLTVAIIQLKTQGYEGDELRLKLVESLETGLEQQTEKGLKTYKKTVVVEDYDFVGWLSHTFEELLDATVYLTCASDLLEVLNGSSTAQVKKATT